MTRKSLGYGYINFHRRPAAPLRLQNDNVGFSKDLRHTAHEGCRHETATVLYYITLCKH